MNTKKVLSDLEKLAYLHAPSGYESRAFEKIKNLFKPYADEIFTDNLGNLICIKKGMGKNSKKIMLDAHMDEIGLMVTKIDEDGFVKFAPIGGIDERVLPSCEVIIHAKRDIKGIIGIKPPHLQSDEETENTFGIGELAIDVGMKKEEAQQVIEVGNSITFEDNYTSLLNNHVSSKSLDDRAGICSLLYAAKKLSDKQIESDVYFVVSVREETSLMGAKCAAYEICPDCALIIDVTHAKTPDNTDWAFETGMGISYSVGPNIHPLLAKIIKEIADKKNIGALAEVDGGSTGTNAWSVQISRNGVASAVVSLPLKYMHTPTEVLSADDICAAGEIAYEFVMRIEKNSDMIDDKIIG